MDPCPEFLNSIQSTTGDPNAHVGAHAHARVLGSDALKETREKFSAPGPRSRHIYGFSVDNKDKAIARKKAEIARLQVLVRENEK